MSLPSHTALPCWALDQRLQSTKQFNSAHKDAEEDEGDAMSTLDAKLDASMGEETDATGHPARTPSADRRQQRNRTLREGT